MSEAFEDGLIDRLRLQEVFIKYLPAQALGKRRVLGIDATPIPRPNSVTRSRIERRNQCTTSPWMSLPPRPILMKPGKETIYRVIPSR
jgi:hypothetical protein